MRCDLEPSWSHLGAVLGPSWGRLGPFWGLLGALLEPFGGHLGPSEAILSDFGRVVGQKKEIAKNIKNNRKINVFGSPGLPKMGPDGPQDRPSWPSVAILSDVIESSCEDVVVRSFLCCLKSS